MFAYVRVCLVGIVITSRSLYSSFAPLPVTTNSSLMATRAQPGISDQ